MYLNDSITDFQQLNLIYKFGKELVRAYLQMLSWKYHLTKFSL